MSSSSNLPFPKFDSRKVHPTIGDPLDLNKESRLLQLPKEIREKIWIFAAVHPRPVQIDFGRDYKLILDDEQSLRHMVRMIPQVSSCFIDDLRLIMSPNIP
jgi:hypothetical protein